VPLKCFDEKGIPRLYRCDRGNEVHQLLISPSKHLYVGHDGRQRYQKKPLDYNLKNMTKCEKELLVPLLLIDHFSGATYGEIATSRDEITSILRFLTRAWSEKTDESYRGEYVFRGMPDMLAIPKVLQDAFPEDVREVESAGVRVFNFESGFQAGAHHRKAFEGEIRSLIRRCNGKAHIDGTRNVASQITLLMSQNHTPEVLRSPEEMFLCGPKIEVWEKTVRNLRMPPKEWKP